MKSIKSREVQLKEQDLDIPSSLFSTNTEFVQNSHQLLMHIHNIYFPFC